jgi:hypothetical protein
VEDCELEVKLSEEGNQVEYEEEEEEEALDLVPPRRSAWIAALAATTAAEEYRCQPRLRRILRVS